ncbi:MAG: flippase-like domain-containing protein [Chitinophagales bacterium]|nr:flippase-like domain-containing protein [Chitinophagales bacterium]
MKQKVGNFIKLALSLGFGIFLFWVFLGRMSPEEKQQTLQTIKSAKWGWLLLIPALGFLSNFNRSERWRYLLQSVGYQPRFWNTFFSVMIMYFANLFIPRSGEVLRCTILNKYEDIPVDKAIGTMLLERILDLVTVLLIAGVLFLAEGDKLLKMWEQKNTSAEAANTPWIIQYIIPIILLVGVGTVSLYIWKKFGFRKFIDIVRGKFMGVWEGLRSIRNVKQPIRFTLHTISMWVCYWGMSYFAFRALPETAHLSIWAGMACLVFGGFAMVAAPGGIGTFFVAIALVLTQYDIDLNIGKAFGLSVWAMQTLAAFSGGLISFAVLALMNKNALSLRKNDL